MIDDGGGLVVGVVVVTAFVREAVVIAVGGLYACVQCVVKIRMKAVVVVEVVEWWWWW